MSESEIEKAIQDMFTKTSSDDEILSWYNQNNMDNNMSACVKAMTKAICVQATNGNF
jgi:intein-encoded DNA endonuclease-like protein